jgi:hypothetical protein
MKAAAIRDKNRDMAFSPLCRHSFVVADYTPAPTNTQPNSGKPEFGNDKAEPGQCPESGLSRLTKLEPEIDPVSERWRFR